jgi:hypothetical protein
MHWWGKRKKEARAGREEAERTLAEVHGRDELIAELGERHQVMLRINHFGESVERAMARKKRHA